LVFCLCGISKADFLEPKAPRLEKWLQNNSHGEMRIHGKTILDKRLDPRLLASMCQIGRFIAKIATIIPRKRKLIATFKISKSAYGNDYHHVIKSKLKALQEFISEEIGPN